MKNCNKCKEDKELFNFFKRKSSKDGYGSVCKKCLSVYWIKPKEILQEGLKRCTICKEVKKLSDFSKKHTIKSGIRSSCKECDKIYVKNNEDKWKKYRKKYNEINKDRLSKNSKLWELKNKEKRKEQKRQYRLKNKHIFAWKNILRNTLKRMNTKKEGHTINLLGYSSLELKEHIEKLFTIGMNWNNYGEWHVDHIKPISSFDKNTSVNIVCSLENLRPLWSTTREIDGIMYEGNLNKGNKEIF